MSARLLVFRQDRTAERVPAAEPDRVEVLTAQIRWLGRLQPARLKFLEEEIGSMLEILTGPTPIGTLHYNLWRLFELCPDCFTLVENQVAVMMDQAAAAERQANDPYELAGD